MPSVSATPGVVVGSYTDRANAQSAAENARRALGAISSEIEIHIVSQGATLGSCCAGGGRTDSVFVVTSAQPGLYRCLVSSTDGCADKAPVGVVASQPVQAVTPVPAVEEQVENQWWWIRRCNQDVPGQVLGRKQWWVKKLALICIV